MQGQCARGRAGRGGRGPAFWPPVLNMPPLPPLPPQVGWVGNGDSQYTFDSVQVVADGIEDNSDGRRYIWSVCGWAGSQRNAVLWTGDDSGSFEFIRWQLTTFVGTGFSGMAHVSGVVPPDTNSGPQCFCPPAESNPVFLCRGPRRRERRRARRRKLTALPYLASWTAEETLKKRLNAGDVDGIFGGSAETYVRDLQFKCMMTTLMTMSGWAANP